MKVAHLVAILLIVGANIAVSSQVIYTELSTTGCKANVSIGELVSIGGAALLSFLLTSALGYTLIYGGASTLSNIRQALAKKQLGSDIQNWIVTQGATICAILLLLVLMLAGIGALCLCIGYLGWLILC